jgi:hypothetical protein
MPAIPQIPIWLPPLLPWLYYGASATILLWDTFLAGQIAQQRTAPRPFAFMSALGALLLAPALLVAAAAGSNQGGRTFDALAWIWPAVTLLFTLQTLYAVGRRMLSPLLGLPILAYNILLTIVTTTRYTLALGATPPPTAMFLAVAHLNVLGYVTGPTALWSPLALQLPLLAPAFPARWRLSLTLRAIIATLAVAWCVATGLELPAAASAVRSYAALAAEPLQERPAGDFTVGLRLLPVVDGAPTASALRNDLALVDSTGAEAVSVVIDPHAHAAALDSLARALEPLRRDTTLLIVTVGYAPDAALAASGSPASFANARLADVSRIVRRLHPDYLLPADEPYGRAARAIGRRPVAYWTRYLTDAAAAAHRIDPRIKIGVAIAAFDSRDSALYAWAASPAAPIDVVGFSLAPDFTGGAALDVKMRTADRWMAAAPAPLKEQWVFAARGFPVAHGEANQARAVWAALAWATSRTAVKGLVVADAGDYDDLSGLRTPAGRLRPVVDVVTRATKSLRETSVPQASVDSE